MENQMEYMKMKEKSSKVNETGPQLNIHKPLIENTVTPYVVQQKIAVTHERENTIKEEQNEIQENALKYHQAEAVLQAERKHLIVTKEYLKAKLVVLNKQLTEVLGLIKKSDEAISILKTEDQILDRRVSETKKQINVFQQHVTKDEEIVSKFQIFFNKERENLKQLNRNVGDIKSQYAAQKKDAAINNNCASVSAMRLKLDQLSGHLEVLKCDRINCENEKSILKQNIFEQRERLISLQELNKKLDEKSDKVETNIEENQKEEDILSQKHKQLAEMKEKLRQIEETSNKEIETLQVKIEEKKENISNLTNSLALSLDKNEQLREQKQTNEILLKSKQGQLDELTTIKKERQDAVLAAKENYATLKSKSENDLITLKLHLENLNNKYEKACSEIDNLKAELNRLETECSEKVNAKDLLLQEKYDLDKKIVSNEILCIRLNDLKTRLDEKTKIKGDLLQKITHLNNEESLQDLLKEKDYLEASMKYLNQKYETTKKKSEEVSKNLTESEKENEKLTKVISEKRKEIDDLKKQLSSLEKETTTSILKPSGRLTEKPSTSKTVKFDQMLEVFSKSSVDTVTSSQEEKPTGIKRLLDGLLKTVNNTQNKPLKRRHYDFDQ